MSKIQNNITWQRFKASFEGTTDRAVNRWLLQQQKLSLSAYYDTRWVLPDGIHTEPIEFH